MDLKGYQKQRHIKECQENQGYQGLNRYQGYLESRYFRDTKEYQEYQGTPAQ